MSWLNSQPGPFDQRLYHLWFNWLKGLFSPSPPQLMCEEHSGAQWLRLHHPGGCYTLLVAEVSSPLRNVKSFEYEIDPSIWLRSCTYILPLIRELFEVQEGFFYQASAEFLDLFLIYWFSLLNAFLEYGIKCLTGLCCVWLDLHLVFQNIDFALSLSYQASDHHQAIMSFSNLSAGQSSFFKSKTSVLTFKSIFLRFSHEPKMYMTKM